MTCNLYTTGEHQTTLVHLQCTNCIRLEFIDCLWFTPCSVLWTSRRSLESTDRIPMATINDYLMDNHRPNKDYFSTLKDIQLFSTGSHCCAQLVSFWLRAMDSPWEPNCTQHDSTDRYAIGSAEVIRQITEWSSVYQCNLPNDSRPLEKPMGTT